MMRVSLVLAAFLATSCSGAGVVRSGSTSLHYDYLGKLKSESGAGRKSGAHYDYMGRLKSESGAVQSTVTTASGAVQPAIKKAAEDKTLDTGFNNAEDLPTVKNPKQISVGADTKSSTPAKAGASGPSFHSDDSNSEHPNVVDAPFQYDTQQTGGGEPAEGGSSLPMLLFLACGGAAIAWMYTTEQSRNQAKDKANSAMQMFGPLVNEAMGAVGPALQAATSAVGLVKNTSIHTRFAVPSFPQKAVSNDDDDLMADDDGEHAKASDPYSDPSAGMNFFDDEPEVLPAPWRQSLHWIFSMSPHLHLLPWISSTCELG